MKKTFLIGVGAPKAGTSWAHSYLDSHPECAASHIKEMAVLSNYFSDNVNFSRRLRKIRLIENELQQAKKRAQAEKDVAKRNERFLLSLDYYAADYDLEYYLSYYRRLMKMNPGAHVVTDVTPGYASLGEEHLGTTRELLENAGYDVKVFLLMRDPVERCYSVQRMGARRKKSADSKAVVTPHKNFFKNATTAASQKQTRYEISVPKLERVFGKENCFFDLYETFISEDGIEAFCKFAGLSFVKPDLGFRANASPRESEPDPAEWQKVRDFYKDTYDFCVETFGAEKIKQAWGPSDTQA